MEDEKNKLPTPAGSRTKLYKILTLSLFFLVLFVAAGYGTVEATSSSGFCSSCHNMKPEYYTWKASAHSQIACKECHIQSGVVNYAKAKANGLVQVYKLATNSYTAPIEMPTPIPNSTCEKCHNMKTTLVTAPGDLIIPHDKHLAKGIQCVQCHSGVVHGNISDRNVTFKTDYSSWNAAIGQQMMSDVTFTQPTMDTCISCHQARDVSTSCKTCHSTGMKPASHNDPNFMKGGHGQLAQKDIQKCNSCHQYMSDNPIPQLQKQTAAEKLLENKSTTTISASDYAKENTFCANCHSKAPASHVTGWINLHGTVAKMNQQQCLACHSEKNADASSITSNGVVSNALPTGGSSLGAPACSTCHPAKHDGKDFKSHHPIDLTGVTKPSERCYTCHDKSTCTACHKEDDGTQTQKDTSQTQSQDDLAQALDSGF